MQRSRIVQKEEESEEAGHKPIVGDNVEEASSQTSGRSSEEELFLNSTVERANPPPISIISEVNVQPRAVATGSP